MIRALIIDDEESGWEVLTELILLKHPEISLLPAAETVEDAVASIDKYQPELVFLDIRLGQDNGFEILQKTTFKNFHVIFVTAYSEYALQAIKASALDYLLKPVNIEELQKAINRFKNIKSRIDQEEAFQTVAQKLAEGLPKGEKITLLTNSGYELVAVKDILYLIADHNYCKVYLKDKTEKLVTRTLGSFVDQLEKQGFLRIHKSHIVNLDQVTVYIPGNGGQVKMSNGHRLEVSRRRKKEVLDLLNVRTGHPAD
ncbi:MAG: response regulator transcription factor [Roseivirga sp.]|nr:response regulator transcription factor [Roseivirga sp.]